MPRVGWNKLLWHRQVIPIHAFCVWKILHKKLCTRKGIHETLLSPYLSFFSHVLVAHSFPEWIVDTGAKKKRL